MSCKDCGDPVEGRSQRCEPCKKRRASEASRAHYERTREERIAKARERYRNDPEYVRAYKRRHAERYRVRRLAKRHGISIEAAQALLAETTCRICGSTERRLVTDHNHRTGDVRGRLCDNCNRAIGLLGDDIEVLEAAIRYLKG